MNGFLGIKFKNDENRALIERIIKTCATCGLDMHCIVKDEEQWGILEIEPHIIMAKTFLAINRAELVLIEMTEKGVGLGIEIGYAAALEKPVIILARNGTVLSKTAIGVAQKVVFYEQPEEFAGEISMIIHELISTKNKESAK